MNVLVLNCGSSTLKFQLIWTTLDAMKSGEDKCLARGCIERLGGESVITLEPAASPPRKTSEPLHDIRGALEFIVRWLASEESGVDSVRNLTGIHAVGHRVVHGGERFVRSTLLTPEVVRHIEDLTDLAPLHNPANVKGIRAVEALLGKDIPQVAVFDTAFHQSLPEKSFLYAIPYQYYRRYALRRYGFHGTSHRYVAYRYRQLLGLPKEQTNIITLHLGNGCSACAIQAGVSIDVSMGLTPLEGLVMGTRSGDIDPAIAHYIAAKEGLDAHQVESVLNKQSGLLGVSGLTHDMRELLAEIDDTNDRRANLAVDIFCYRVRKYIGAYLAAMGGADAVVFTGGIGQNSARIRAKVCEGLSWMGLSLDAEKNENCILGQEGPVHTSGSRLKAYVIPTDEELLIARDTVRCVQGEIQ
ncbi:MAG: acetate kinase [Acidobacteria bacterium]|nr:acetate kinase [Acidobacteriota bacterium]